MSEITFKYKIKIKFVRLFTSLIEFKKFCKSKRINNLVYFD